MTTAVVWEELYTKHSMGEFHPESPARLRAIKNLLDNDSVGKVCLRLPARAATREEIAWIHDLDYIEKIESTKGREVYLDPDTSTSPMSWEAAVLAAGGAIVATESVLKGDVDNAFAFVRPPGHHAERDHAMGFCIFNNIAIAAEYAIKKCSIKRVAIVDFDVHHGNGTQHAFESRNDVLYISTHHYPFYPGSGSRVETGIGPGKGFTLNIPLEAESGDAEFIHAFTTEVIPKLEFFNPQLILVSAGYDIHNSDPLGGMSVTTDGVKSIAKLLVNAAKKLCNGKIVFVLEGGYSLSAIRDCVKVTLEAMSA